MTWPFGDMRMFAYDFIMADPPWKFLNRSPKGEKKNATAHYRCETLDEICALPVGHLAGRNCVLWLWATNPMLPEALIVLKAWGFKYSTAGSWVKRTTHGKLGFGTGYVLRSASEPFLIATAGSQALGKSTRSVVESFEGLAFDGELREHSRKPEEAYAAAEKMVPGAWRRADLFSRTTRPGWDAWGDEAGKFDEAA